MGRRSAVHDPALYEALAGTPPEQQVEAVVLLVPGHDLPSPARVVARFGSIVTCRMPAHAVLDVRDHPAVQSVKASRTYRVDPLPMGSAEQFSELGHSEDILYEQWSRAAKTGLGVVVACLDWGCDFAHPNFRTADGRTRLLALWDQRDGRDRAANQYGYGTIHSQSDIDRALGATDPYGALGYHPGDKPAHGTVVLDIAAGNGAFPGSRPGLAPDAGLVFVHLAAGNTAALGDLGDSVRLLEGIDFVRTIAGNRPWVCNLSLGRTGGDHTGRSLVERALDTLLEETAGCAITMSCGNYYAFNTHAEGWLRPGGSAELQWLISPLDSTPNELEIWYAGRDRFDVILEAPDGRQFTTPLGTWISIDDGGREQGRLYHRERDPLNGDHHIDIFLRTGARAGTWRVVLHGLDVVDGRFHAWIERDAATAVDQSQFPPHVASPRHTIGTIANGFRTISVGAYDVRTGELGPWSSSGPTRDFRTKPDLIAPGVRIRAARSATKMLGSGLTVMSGTSMAAPHVAGTIARMFEAAPRPLRIDETRRLLLGTADAVDLDPDRVGAGALNPDAAVAAVRALVSSPRSDVVPHQDVESQMTYRNGEKLEDDVVARIKPGQLFRELIDPGSRSHRGIQILAFPGDRLAIPVRAGDVLLRVAPGERGLAFGAVLADAALIPRDHIAARGWTHERGPRGRYARVVELDGNSEPRDNAPARLITDERGIVPPGQMLLRMEADARELESSQAESDEPSAEEVRFAQRVLNRAENARLTVDGVLGRHTRDALARFRSRQNLGIGGDLDDNTELALAQRALEELAQQSLFAHPGALDAATQTELTRFKVEHGLQANATLDAATRAALADALDQRAAPTQMIPTQGTASWTTTPPEQRMAYVMNLLVQKYRYPPNGAAGIVGNLWAESGLLPNRLEGSRPATPMRTLSFSNLLTDFTPEQAMNRSPHAGQGPRKPGVGLAQWTTAARRAGLFTHEFEGQVLGPAILDNMDAQVDYLVSELGSTYRAVDRVLRNESVQLADASDEVVYRFEVPGSVLTSDHPRRLRPRTDPAVQEIFHRRRDHSTDALRAYLARSPETTARLQTNGSSVPGRPSAAQAATPSSTVTPASSLFDLGRPVAADVRAIVSSGWARPRSHGLHRGLDIPLRVGTPILAVDSGRVTYVDNEDRGDAGRWVAVLHPSGLTSRYLHLSQALATVGAMVSRGDTIGLSGNTGNSAGPHLHLDLRVPREMLADVERAIGRPSTGWGTEMRRFGFSIPGEPWVPVDDYRRVVRVDAARVAIPLRSITRRDE